MGRKQLAILVETRQPATVRPDSSVSGVLPHAAAEEGTFAGLKINTDYVLIHGRTPPGLTQAFPPDLAAIGEGMLPEEKIWRVRTGARFDENAGLV